MDIDKYREFRVVYMDLTSRIFKAPKGDLKRAAKRLNLLHEDTFVFDDDEEVNWLTDFVLYEKNGRTDRLIDRFKREGHQLSMMESQLLDSVILNKSSLYEIVEVIPEANTVVLLDLISKEEFEIMDIGLSSNSAFVGYLLFTRLIPIEETNMTSGILLVFTSDKKLMLYNAIRKRSIGRRKFKAKNRISRKTLFEKMVDCYRKYGEVFHTIKPSEYQNMS